MKSFIFDVDGTLIDSYDGITESVINVLNKYNYKMENIREYILNTSVLDLFVLVSNKINVSLNILFNEYKIEREKTSNNYKFMDNVIECISYLYKKGYNIFIYTHKSKAINKILIDNKIDYLFKDVISSDSEMFKRKPDPTCLNYLIDKYNLDKEDTYYVGDRKIDVECANNANIKSILYRNNKNIKSDYYIEDFKELINIFK